MKMKIAAHVDKDRNHIIRSETGAVIAVLVDYPLCRDSLGKLIVDAINKSNAPADLPAVAGKVRRDVGQEVKP